MMHMSQPARGLPRDLSIVRIKLGPDRAAPQPDPLGRDRVGFRDGLAVAELWERGRGVWKARLTTVAEADLAVLVAQDVVQLVATVDGVTFHDDRVAITGRPLPGHPLIGSADPIPNRSQNPIAYGAVTTLPPEAAAVEELPGYDELLGRAVEVLTAAVRYERPTLRQNDDGKWEPDPDRTERGDWAEFVTLALAGAAANAGGIEAALAGRSGSWEAYGVRQLLESTVGDDEGMLWRHRTEPVRLTVYADELLTDADYDAVRAYEDAATELQRRYEVAERADPEPDYERYCWCYDRTEAGDFVARDPAAPAWSWDAWRAQPKRVENDDYSALIEEAVRSGQQFAPTTFYVFKSQEDAEELWRLEDERDGRMQPFAQLEDQLETLRSEELRSYGQALKSRIEYLAQEVPCLAVPVQVDVDVTTFRSSSDRDIDEAYSLEGRLLSQAMQDTPTPSELPGSPLDRLLASQPDHVSNNR